MTTRSISNQVRAIKSATAKATSSKEAAVAFLRQAGIIAPQVKPALRVAGPNTEAIEITAGPSKTKK